MLRYLPVILLTCVMLGSPFGGAIAQSKHDRGRQGHHAAESFDR